MFWFELKLIVLNNCDSYYQKKKKTVIVKRLLWFFFLIDCYEFAMKNIGVGK